MRLITVVCVATLVVAAYGHEDPKAMTEQMNRNFNTLDKLTARMMNLKDKVEERLETRRNANVESNNMIRRLDRMNGGECSGDEFNCGNQKCVSKMLVCDEENDCGNNADEEADVCTSPAQPQDSFSGFSVFDYCTRRKPDRVTLQILSDARNTVYTPIINVEGRIIMTSTVNGRKLQSSLPINGFYTFGTRVLYFYPPEDDKLAINLVFAAGNNDVAEARIIQEESGKDGAMCAKFVLRRD